MKILKTILMSLVALALLIIIGAFVVGDVDIKITQEQAQEKIAAKLPITKSKLGVTATVDAVAIEMTDMGLINVVGGGDVAGFGMNGTLTFSTESGVRYEDGRFFLKDVALDDFHLTPTQDTEAVIEDRKTLFLGKLADVRAKISGGDAEEEEAFDEEAGRMATAVKTRINEMMNTAIADTPIYDMNTGPFWMKLGVAAIKNVSVSAGEIVVSVSPFAFIMNLLKFVVILILAVLGTLGMMSGWMFSGSRH